MTLSVSMPGWKALRGLALKALPLPHRHRRPLPVIYRLATSYTCGSRLMLMHVGTQSVCTRLGPGNISALERACGERPER